MNYLILAETEFFGLVNGNDETVNLNASYNDFVRAVVALYCESTDRNSATIALAYVENELQYRRTQYGPTNQSHISFYVCKALSFVRKMQKLLAASHTQVPPLSHPSCLPKETTAAIAPVLKWTGNAIDLVEMIYGINEMGCINHGEITLKELAPVLYSFFGVESKDCYRFYIDIKRRKNESRTYFLDRMQAKLNEKMRHDDELERMRR